MKKKSLLVVVSAACISVMLAACTGDVSAEVEPAEEQEIIIAEVQPEAGAEEVIEPEVEPEVEEEVPEEPEVDPNVELTMEYLEVSEDWLKDYEGVGLKRDGKLYCLADGVPAENWDNTNMSLVNGDNSAVNARGDSGYDIILMDDRFVIPSVTVDDDVAWYGESIASITFIPMEFYGYTTNILLDTDTGINLAIANDPKYVSASYQKAITNYKDKGFLLIDSDGLEVSDMRSLYQGETYTAKWNDNGEQECELIANWQYYKADESGAITIETIPTDDPEVTKIDLSSLPKGTYYMVESYAMVTIE